MAGPWSELPILALFEGGGLVSREEKKGERYREDHCRRVLKSDEKEESVNTKDQAESCWWYNSSLPVEDSDDSSLTSNSDHQGNGWSRDVESVVTVKEEEEDIDIGGGLESNRSNRRSRKYTITTSNIMSTPTLTATSLDGVNMAEQVTIPPSRRSSVSSNKTQRGRRDENQRASLSMSVSIPYSLSNSTASTPSTITPGTSDPTTPTLHPQEQWQRYDDQVQEKNKSVLVGQATDLNEIVVVGGGGVETGEAINCNAGNVCRELMSRTLNGGHSVDREAGRAEEEEERAGQCRAEEQGESSVGQGRAKRRTSGEYVEKESDASVSVSSSTSGELALSAFFR